MENSNNYRDPLLDCLLYIAHSKHIHCTESGLIADLPLVEGRLSPELALRCCERLGIEAKVVSRELSEIPAEVLPAILVGKENSAMVLMGLDQEAQEAKVYDGERGLYRLPISAVTKKYSGYAIFLSQNIENISQDLADLGLGGSPSDHWFWSTIKQSWRIYRDVLVASFFINIFALAMPLFVMNVYDRVVPNDAIETLWVLSLGVLLVASFDFILKTLRVYFIEIAGKKSDILLSSFIFSRVMGAKFKYHPKSSGVFANQLREFESVRTFITSAAVTTIVDLPFALLFFLIIAYIGGQIIWVAVIAAPVLLAYAWWVQKRLSETVSHSLAASANKNSTLVDAMVGLETLKSLGAEGRALHRWEQSSGRLAYWGLKSRIYSSSATNVAALILQLASVSVVVVGVYSISDRALTMGALVASVMLVGRALSPMVGIANLLVQYQQAKLAFLSLSEIVKKPQERPSGRSFIQREELEGAVEFKEVSFSYPEEKIAALTNVSFALKPGEKLAVIGKLGSGKSSLQRLIMRLHEPSIGNILLDGTDVAQMDPADVRKNIGYVPQDSLLFSGTIRENIAYRNTWVSDADVLNAAEIAGVTAFTSHHPLGLERQVGERGEALSGGQRQAICLARALALRPNLLLLDEPTSAMDNSTESTIVNKLKTYCEHRTLMLVTHRTSLLQLVDRIIVLEDGKLVADGPREFVVDALKKGQLRVS